jgi:hypothetical protein
LPPVEAGGSGARTSLKLPLAIFTRKGDSMKRLALALAVVGLMACKKSEEAAPPMADSAMAPAAAPAPMDSMAMGDTSKMMMMDETKKPN